jgi:hypothetical protein
MNTPQKMKKYFKNDLVQVYLGFDIFTGRIAAYHKERSFVSVRNPINDKLVTVELKENEIIGKIPESMNVDFLPLEPEFESGEIVKWEERGVTRYARVLYQKGHETFLHETNAEGAVLSIPSISLTRCESDAYGEKNSMKELAGFYIRQENFDEEGKLLSFVIAHRETRVVSVKFTDVGVKVDDVDLVDGKQNLMRILNRWAEGLDIKTPDVVLTWYDWMKNHWQPSLVSDYEYSASLKMRVAA